MFINSSFSEVVIQVINIGSMCDDKCSEASILKRGWLEENPPKARGPWEAGVRLSGGSGPKVPSPLGVWCLGMPNSYSNQTPSPQSPRQSYCHVLPCL